MRNATYLGSMADRNASRDGAEGRRPGVEVAREATQSTRSCWLDRFLAQSPRETAHNGSRNVRAVKVLHVAYVTPRVMV